MPQVNEVNKMKIQVLPDEHGLITFPEQLLMKYSS
jgi:hypothetical protein